MALPSFKARAPGSLIIMGEYAVLHGFPAIVTAVNKYIMVTLTPRPDDKLCIYSELGQIGMTINAIIIQHPFEFVLTALKLTDNLPSGVNIHIESEFPSTIGLGSSAAVTVALITALYRWKQQPIDLKAIYQNALQVIQQVQGGGSGADVAASTFGGTILYQNEPVTITPLPDIPWLAIIYSGQKASTTKALNQLKRQVKENPEMFTPFFAQLGELTSSAKTAILNNQWFQLGKLMNEAQTLLVEFGVSTPVIDNIVTALRQQLNILGAKLSGAGLGDCVIGLGRLDKEFFPRNSREKKLGIQQLDVKIQAAGVSCVQ